MAITIVQGFEGYNNISANNPNIIKLSGVDTYIDITYTMTNGQVVNTRYASIAGNVRIDVEDVLSRGFSSKHIDDFNYLMNKTYTETDNYHFYKLNLSGVDKSGETVAINNVLVLNSYMPISYDYTVEDLTAGTILTLGQTPYFSFHPKSVSKLYDNRIERNIETGANSSEIINDCDGVYVKWLNSYGGYDYWLFNNYSIEKSRAKEVGTVSEIWDNRIQARATEHTLGYNVSEQLEIFSNVKKQYIHIVKEIFESTEVYLYRKIVNSSYVWQKVRVKGSVSIVSNREYTKLKATLILPKKYTRKGI